VANERASEPTRAERGSRLAAVSGLRDPGLRSIRLLRFIEDLGLVGSRIPGNGSRSDSQESHAACGIDRISIGGKDRAVSTGDERA